MSMNVMGMPENGQIRPGSTRAFAAGIDSVNAMTIRKLRDDDFPPAPARQVLNRVECS